MVAVELVHRLTSLPMARASHDLHGSAPDKSEAALLLIDVINDFDFPEGDQLLRLALPVETVLKANTSSSKQLDLNALSS